MSHKFQILVLMIAALFVHSIFNTQAAITTSAHNYVFTPATGTPSSYSTINAAINYINSQNQGGELRIPPGVTYITSTLEIKKPNITLAGYGGNSNWAGSMIKSSTQGLTFIDVQASSVTIKDLSITGTTSALTTGIKLSSDYSYNTTIQNCSLKWHEYGIYKNSTYLTYNLLIQDCLIDTCNKSFVKLSYVSNLKMKDIETVYCDGIGIDLSNILSATFDRTAAQGCKKTGLSLSDSYFQILFDQCIFDACTSAILAIKNVSGTIIIRDGWVATSGLNYTGSTNAPRQVVPGISISSSPTADVTIESNLISFCGAEGVRADNVRSINLIGNNFAYNSFSENQASYKSGASLTNFTSATVEGNTFIGAGPIQKYGLSAASGNTLTCIGNQFYKSYNTVITGGSNVTTSSITNITANISQNNLLIP